MITPAQLDEWERLANEATRLQGGSYPNMAKFGFVASKAVPALVAEVRRLRETLQLIESFDLETHPCTEEKNRAGFWCDGPCGGFAREALK